MRVGCFHTRVQVQRAVPCGAVDEFNLQDEAAGSVTC